MFLLNITAFIRNSCLRVRPAAAFFLAFFFSVVSTPVLAQSEDAISFPPLFTVDVPSEFPDAAATFNEVRQLILNNYYTPSIREEDLYYAAIEGMLRHISPPNTPRLGKIWPPDAYQAVRRSLQGIQIAIGIHTRFEKASGALVVEAVIPDSPAENVLLPHDRILRIDGRPLKNRTSEEIESMLSGDAETQVAFTINRDIEIFDVLLVRKEMDASPIRIDTLSDTVGYVELTNFTAGLSAKLQQELTDLAAADITALVLDLRRNSGGVFMEALRTAELFMKQKQILLRTVQRKTPLQNYISSNTSPFPFRLAVLIGPETASSAELFAAAIRDHDRGIIIGAHSFGKAVVETTFPLKNNYRVKFITGAMYSPSGKSWQGTGIVPDYFAAAGSQVRPVIQSAQSGNQLLQDPGVITALKLLTP